MEPIALSWFFIPPVVVVSMALVLRVRPDPKEIASRLGDYYPDYTPPPATPQPAGKVGILHFVRHYPKLTAFASMFSAQGNMNMMMVMTSLALSRHDYTLTSISVSVAIHVMGMFGFSLPLGRLADRIGRRNVMLLGLVLASLGSWLIVATSRVRGDNGGHLLRGAGLVVRQHSGDRSLCRHHQPRRTRPRHRRERHLHGRRRDRHAHRRRLCGRVRELADARASWAWP